MVEPTVPAPQPTGTVDITATVENLRQAWVTWAVAFLYGEELTIPGLQEVVALPLVSDIDREVLRVILNALSNDMVMLGFFMNTAIRKASQAADFNNAVAAKNALPPTASTQEVLNAEQAKSLAFRNFVMLSN